jgi:hypothetical protein
VLPGSLSFEYNFCKAIIFFLKLQNIELGGNGRKRWWRRIKGEEGEDLLDHVLARARQLFYEDI